MDSELKILLTIILVTMEVVVTEQRIPTTVEGPFEPVTRRFDPSLRRGSDDLPIDHPRLKKNVTSIFPEQIALAISSPTSMWVSWVTGDAKIGSNVTPLDPSSVDSEVWYGKQSGKYSSKRRGNSTVYSQLYPFAGLFNYTSGIIHHVRIDGLEPGTKYYFKCGDSSFPAMSEEHAFETLPLPSPTSYPRRIAVVGDLGLTSNTSTTVDHLIKNDPSFLLMVGDLSYANQYLTTGGKGASCYSCAFPDAPIRETYQPRWDGWGRYVKIVYCQLPESKLASMFSQDLKNKPEILRHLFSCEDLNTSKLQCNLSHHHFIQQFLGLEHYQPRFGACTYSIKEIGGSASNLIHWKYRFMEPLTSRVPMMVIEGNHEIEPQVAGITFKSYLTRFAVPSEESGSNNNFYYSFDAGGIHFIMLGAYVDYNSTGAQYAWLKEDLHRADRTVTPWLIAAWHPPWYNSYSSHYQEFECMRQEMEALLYQYGVDIVFSGHVHAYERMNRVYNYSLDPCGPVYITVGDGGNIEEIDVDHSDDPGKCPTAEDNIPEFGGVCHLNFSSGPAKGNFCWSKQPEWSAFRESSFGHGILEVMNSTSALWTWHRNQDIYKEESSGDQIYIVRQPELCSASPGLKGNNQTQIGRQKSETASISARRWKWVLSSFFMAFTAVNPINAISNCIWLW